MEQVSLKFQLCYHLSHFDGFPTEKQVLYDSLGYTTYRLHALVVDVSKLESTFSSFL